MNKHNSIRLLRTLFLYKLCWRRNSIHECVKIFQKVSSQKLILPPFGSALCSLSDNQGVCARGAALSIYGSCRWTVLDCNNSASGKFLIEMKRSLPGKCELPVHNALARNLKEFVNGLPSMVLITCLEELK